MTSLCLTQIFALSPTDRGAAKTELLKKNETDKISCGTSKWHLDVLHSTDVVTFTQPCRADTPGLYGHCHLQISGTNNLGQGALGELTFLRRSEQRNAQLWAQRWPSLFRTFTWYSRRSTQKFARCIRKICSCWRFFFWWFGTWLLWLSIYWEKSSSQLTNSYFSEG